MDSTRIEVLRFQLNQFKELVELKNKYTSELQKTIQLYNKAKKMKSAYENIDINDVNNKELENYTNEEKKYVTLMNEYAEKFANVNSQLVLFDEAKANEVNSFFELVALHERISLDIRAAENLSKGNNGLQLQVISAEGRKKKIAVDLVDEYQSLVERKNAVAKEMTGLYKKMCAIGEIKREEIIKTEPATQTMQVTSFPQQTLSNNEDEIVDYWQSLSDEEKETELAERLERIRGQFDKPGMGKKKLISVDGQKMDVPVSLIGIFNSTKGQLAGIRAKIAAKNNINQAYPTQISQELGAVQNDQRQNIKMVESIPEEQKIVSIDKPKTNIFSKIKKKALLIVAAVVTIAAIGTGIALNYIHPSNTVTNEQVVPQPTTITQTYAPQSSPTYTPNIIDEKVLPTPMPVTAPTLTSMPSNDTYTVVKGDTLIDIARDNDTTYRELARINNIPNPDLIFPKQEIVLPSAKQTSVVTQPEQAPVIEEKVQLAIGDNVNIDKDSYIYKTAADSIERTTPYRPYYDNSLVRVVKGLIYELDGGKYFTLFASDKDFNSKQQSFIDAGYKIKAVLTCVAGNEDGYEGFYNVDDVNKKTMEVSYGNSR